MNFSKKFLISFFVLATTSSFGAPSTQSTPSASFTTYRK